MNNLTLIDLVLMLQGHSEGAHQTNLGILRSMYERSHGYFLSIIGGMFILFGVIVGGLIAVIAQNTPSNPIVLIASVVVALIILLFIIGFIFYRLSRLERTYLDLIQIYNLLRQYF